ncbi:MAG: hypothetical protein B9S32_10520 [Verrucomicrobia bacterium Tous-C9LFEB]|nr:MAG: hypothetical protein B9S32_10520 [Verrucomicrobia bacterium Tous-C9LFEB]
MCRMFRRLTVSALLVLGMAACQPIDKNLEAEDSRNPHFKKAESYTEAKNYVEAVREYEAALQANPNVATAHYELGRIYGEKLGDEISSMYHFSKFLELRPTSEKRESVQALLDNAKFSLATKLPNSPVANAEMFARLQSENANLKRELEEVQSRVARLDQQQQNAAAAVSTPAPAPTATPTAAPEAPKATPVAPVAHPTTPAPAAAAVVPVAPSTAPTATPAATAVTEARSHTIAKGDTLWKIARKYYKGDVNANMDKIKAANASQVDFTKPLKLGTVLVIP